MIVRVFCANTELAVTTTVAAARRLLRDPDPERKLGKEIIVLLYL